MSHTGVPTYYGKYRSITVGAGVPGYRRYRCHDVPEYYGGYRVTGHDQDRSPVGPDK